MDRARLRVSGTDGTARPGSLMPPRARRASFAASAAGRRAPPGQPAPRPSPRRTALPPMTTQAAAPSLGPGANRAGPRRGVSGASRQKATRSADMFGQRHGRRRGRECGRTTPCTSLVVMTVPLPPTLVRRSRQLVLGTPSVRGTRGLSRCSQSPAPGVRHAARNGSRFHADRSAGRRVRDPIATSGNPPACSSDGRFRRVSRDSGARV
jgi:hypothetical protein